MATIQARMETALQRLLPASGIAPEHLHRAMRYAVLGAANACVRCSPSPRASWPKPIRRESKS